MFKNKSESNSLANRLIEIVYRNRDGCIDLGATLHPSLGRLNESERTRILASLESICRVLGEHIARTFSEETGLQVESKVRRVN